MSKYLLNRKICQTINACTYTYMHFCIVIRLVHQSIYINKSVCEILLNGSSRNKMNS